MRGPPAIEVVSASKRYVTPAGVVAALDRITLVVEAGTSVAVIGPSGCGKSTLLALMGALDSPTAGHVLIGGVAVAGLSAAERARLRRDEFGFVFQSDSLLPFLTAAENVALHLALQGEPDGNARCLAMLGAVGLGAHAEKLPDQLSGGQRQRVAVAGALVHRPGVVLADEPTGSLDAASAATVLGLLVDAQRESGATLVVVTHDPAVARQLDRTVRLEDGRVAHDAGRADRPTHA